MGAAPGKYRVLLVDLAEQDLVEVYRWVAAHESVERAEEVLSRLEDACRALGQLPTRGRVPPELARIGVTNYRQVTSKPWRIFYAIEGNTVFVAAVLDGRRDMQTLLERRLLR